jgi:hypothetical protein
MAAFFLTDRSGQTFEASALSVIVNNPRLCNDLFGCAVPREMDASQAMAWSQKQYKTLQRRIENLRSVFLHNMEIFQQDDRMTRKTESLI